jgi:small neutral amino acid transporter SnatA (MarC family)
MLEKIIRDFMTIWTTVGPISNLALFAGLTAAMHRSERRRIAWRASLYAVKCTGFWLFSSSRDNDKILRIVAIMRATVPR